MLGYLHNNCHKALRRPNRLRGADELIDKRNTSGDNYYYTY